MTNNCIMCIQYFLLGFTFLIALICLACQNTVGVSLHVNLSQFKQKFAWMLMLKPLDLGGVRCEAAGPRSCCLTAGPGQPGPGRCSNGAGGSSSMATTGKGCFRWDFIARGGAVTTEAVAGTDGSRTLAMSRLQITD